MTIQGMDARWNRILVIVAAIVIVGGCTMKRGEPVTAVPEPQQPVVEEAPQPNPTRSDSERLSSIQEFLDRTRQYQTSPTPADGWNLPAGQAASPQQPQTQPVANQTARAPSPATFGGDVTPVGQPVARANAQVALADIRPKTPQQAVPVLLAMSIESSVPQAAANPAPAGSDGVLANKPQDVRSATTELTDEWVSALQEQLDASPGFDAEWSLRLAQLAIGRDLDAEKISTDLPADVRRLMLSFVNLAGTVRRVARNPQFVDEPALERVNDLRTIMLERADPKVSSVALCRKVVGFGVFDEMPEEELMAGRAVRVLVYCEIERLRAEVDSEGLYKTELGTRLELLTADGQLVWESEEPKIEDVCRKQRRDFFLTLPVTLPNTLVPADYVLKVWVEDKLAGRASEAALPFTLHSPMSLANRS